jgi:DNA mismatch repair protein MutS
MANIDICTGKTILFQFKETYLNNPTTYDELERFISIHKPSEVILISNLPAGEINSVISYANIQAKMIHKIDIDGACLSDQSTSEKVKRALRCEKQVYQKEIIERFYQIDDFAFATFMQNFYENDISAQAFCFLLDFVYQHNPYLVKKIGEPVFETYSDRLILANHSLKQLNIIDDANYQGKYSSVLKMLNICLTPMGKRKFAYQFLNPRMNEDYLNKEYAITEHMMQNEGFYHFLKNKLADLKDISKWSRQIYMKKISPKLVCQIFSNMEMIQAIYETLHTDATFMEYLGSGEMERDSVIQGSVPAHAAEIREFIGAHIDIGLASEIDALQNYEVNFIKRGVHKELDNEMETMMESLDKLEAIRKFLNDKISCYEKKSSKTLASGASAGAEYVKINETEKNNLSLLSTKRRCTLLKTNLASSAKANTSGEVELEYLSSYDSAKKKFLFSISEDTI